VNEAIYEVLTLHLIFSYRDILLVLVSTISEKPYEQIFTGGNYINN